MKFGLLVTLCLLLSACFSTDDTPAPEYFGQIDARDIRINALVESPAKLLAQSSSLKLNLLTNEGVQQHVFAVKLLGVEMQEESVGFFTSDIEYNSHLLSLEQEDIEKFNSLTETYAQTEFSFELLPSFTNLPNREKMYFSALIKTKRFGEFEVIEMHKQIDVPR